MNCTASVTADKCEVWAPTQVQQRSQDLAAAASGLPKASCIIHTTFLGGGFGRRLEADYVQEAVEVSKAIGGPVKVTWTREDDIQGDVYRPMSVNIVRGVLADGEVSALSHQITSPSWLRRWAPYPPAYKDGIDILDRKRMAGRRADRLGRRSRVSRLGARRRGYAGRDAATLDVSGRRSGVRVFRGLQ